MFCIEDEEEEEEEEEDEEGEEDEDGEEDEGEGESYSSPIEEMSEAAKARYNDIVMEERLSSRELDESLREMEILPIDDFLDGVDASLRSQEERYLILWLLYRFTFFFKG